jgi:hypothetical protein
MSLKKHPALILGEPTVLHGGGMVREVFYAKGEGY